MKVIISTSTRKDKKLMAIFYDDTNKKIKTVHFGSNGMSDYTLNKDKKRKELYLNRHRKNTLRASIKDYKRRFKLN